MMSTMKSQLLALLTFLFVLLLSGVQALVTQFINTTISGAVLVNFNCKYEYEKQLSAAYKELLELKTMLSSDSLPPTNQTQFLTLCAVSLQFLDLCLYFE